MDTLAREVGELEKQEQETDQLMAWVRQQKLEI